MLSSAVGACSAGFKTQPTSDARPSLKFLPLRAGHVHGGAGAGGAEGLQELRVPAAGPAREPALRRRCCISLKFRHPPHGCCTQACLLVPGSTLVWPRLIGFVVFVRWPGRLCARWGGRQQHGRRRPAWRVARHRIQQRQQQQLRQRAWTEHASGRRQRGLRARRQRRRRRPSPSDGGLPAAAAPADEQQLCRQHACIAQPARVCAASAAITAAAAAAAATTAVWGLSRTLQCCGCMGNAIPLVTRAALCTCSCEDMYTSQSRAIPQDADSRANRLQAVFRVEPECMFCHLGPQFGVGSQRARVHRRCHQCRHCASSTGPSCLLKGS